MHDDLTNLPSRKGFFNELCRQVSPESGNSGKVACLLVNVHELKKINTALGYKSGDTILKEFANRLRCMLRESDTAARIGDNKFALVLTSIMNNGHAILAANKILTLLDEPFSINDNQINIRITMGIALYPEHASNAEMLLQNTEIALEQAKSTHVEYHLYCKESNTTEQRNLILEKELKDAIEGGELVMHYQPQISIQQPKVRSMEALVRWQHPHRGVVLPDRFISLAEKCGLIVPLTLWTLNTTLRNSSQCFKQWEDFSVSVNLSAALLHEPDLVELIQQAMQIWGTRPNSLVLEVTESAVMVNPEKSLETLTKLHDSGISISIDDFGTGYSSLAYLKQLPVNELKIDKSFVMNMTDNEDDRKIVRSIIDLGHNFDLSVVAEGIEDEQTLSELRGMDCDIGQGYYISHPLPMDEMQQWIHTTSWNK